MQKDAQIYYDNCATSASTDNWQQQRNTLVPSGMATRYKFQN